MRSTQRPDTLAQDQITPSSPISLATHRRSIHSGSTRDLKVALNEIQIWSASPSGADARSKTEYQGGRRAMTATHQRRFTLLWNRPRSPAASKSHCSCWAVSSASPGLDRQDALDRHRTRLPEPHSGSYETSTSRLMLFNNARTSRRRVWNTDEDAASVRPAICFSVV